MQQEAHQTDMFFEISAGILRNIVRGFLLRPSTADIADLHELVSALRGGVLDGCVAGFERPLPLFRVVGVAYEFVTVAGSLEVLVFPVAVRESAVPERLRPAGLCRQ